MAELGEKIFEPTKMIVAGLVVADSQMAVDGPFSDQRGLAAGCWVQLVLMRHLQPDPNVREVAKWLV